MLGPSLPRLIASITSQVLAQRPFVSTTTVPFASSLSRVTHIPSSEGSALRASNPNYNSNHQSTHASYAPLLLVSAATAATLTTTAVNTYKHRHPRFGACHHRVGTVALAESRHAYHSSSSDNENPKHRLTPVDVHYAEESVRRALEDIRSKSNSDNIGQLPQSLLQCCKEDQSAAAVTLIGYKGGDLSAQINQDRAIVWNPYNMAGGSAGSSSRGDDVLVGVFDGHAPLGEHVSEYAASHLPTILADRLASIESNDNDASSLKTLDEKKKSIGKVLDDVFVEIDQKAPAEESGGCTATIVVRHNRQIYVANAGDSTGLICTYRVSTKTAAIVYRTREDKPSLPEERERVEKMGGQVYIPLRGTSRVVYHDAVTGVPTGLAMSRSLGDWQAGKLGVIPNPVVQALDVDTIVQDAMSKQPEGGIDDEDDVYIFCVAATDGMMDFLSPEDVARVVGDSLCRSDTPHILTACERLVYAAANAWQQSKQGRYRDDISLAVSVLRDPHKQI